MIRFPNYGRIDGPIVVIGFGSIGRGTLPLIERHFDFDARKFVVIDPAGDHHTFLTQRGIRHVQVALTPENYREVLIGLLEPGVGFCVNLSVDVSSLAVMQLCRELQVPYIDTANECWTGFYSDDNRPNAERTNYALRERVSAEARANPGGSTAISCCGANPGMVSWFVKDALLTLARDLGHETDAPACRHGWAALMQSLGVKGIHIAERDTQKSFRPKRIGTFVNTWSVEGFLSEGFQPAELGWGTYETWFPEDGHRFDVGCQASIWMARPGAITKVHSWCPTSCG